MSALGRLAIAAAMASSLNPESPVAEEFGWIDNIINGQDTSIDRKRRKERARMLSMQRQAELQRNPKPAKRKRRGKK